MDPLRGRRAAGLGGRDGLPAAPAVKDALRAAVDRDDAGYANPAASGSPPGCAGFVERRMDWSPDPEQVITCTDVVAGLTDLLRVITKPGDR